MRSTTSSLLQIFVILILSGDAAIAPAAISQDQPIAHDSANLAEARAAWIKREEVISSVEFAFIRELVSENSDYISPGDLERRRYILPGENVFASWQPKIRAERYDKDGDLFTVETANGKNAYAFTYAKDIPGRAFKDNLVIEDGKNGNAHIDATFMGPRGFWDMNYNVFYVWDSLMDENAQIQTNQKYFIILVSMGPFSGKIFLDPAHEYSLVKTELLRDNKKACLTTIDSFTIQQVNGVNIYIPKQASMELFDTSFAQEKYAYTEKYTVENVIINRNYKDEEFTLKPIPGHKTSVWEPLSKLLNFIVRHLRAANSSVLHHLALGPSREVPHLRAG